MLTTNLRYIKTHVYKNKYLYIFIVEINKYSLFSWLMKIKFVNDNILILNLIFLYLYYFINNFILFYKQHKFYEIFLKFKKY